MKAKKILHEPCEERACYAARPARKQPVVVPLLPAATRMDDMPDINFNKTIKKQLESGDVHSARSSMKEMTSLGLQPNQTLFNEILDVTIRSYPAEKWQVVQEMRSAGLTPNAVTCSILLKGTSKDLPADDIERTLSAVADLGAGIDDVLFASVLEACIRRGRTDLLAKQLARQRGSFAIHMTCTQSFGSLIRAYGFVKDLDGIWASWREMRRAGICPSSITLGCMVEAVSMNGDPDAALQLIHECLKDAEVRPVVNAIAFCSVLKSFSRMKKFDRVWEVYADAKSHIDLSIAFYNALIDACVRSFQMHRVSSILKDMASSSIQPNVITYGTIIKGYCQENRLESALELHREMRSVSGLGPDEHTYNTLIDGCARRGFWDKGLGLLQEMEESGIRPTNFTLSVLVKLARCSHKLPEAFEMCKTLSAKYGLRLNTPVYNNLIHTCVASHQLTRGLEVFQKMLRERIQPDERTFKLLLQSCIAEGEAKHAAGLLCISVGVTSDFAPVVCGRGLGRPEHALSAELVTEILQGIAHHCQQADLACETLQHFRSLRLSKDQLLAAPRVNATSWRQQKQ